MIRQCPEHYFSEHHHMSDRGIRKYFEVVLASVAGVVQNGSSNRINLLAVGASVIIVTSEKRTALMLTVPKCAETSHGTNICIVVLLSYYRQ